MVWVTPVVAPSFVVLFYCGSRKIMVGVAPSRAPGAALGWAARARRPRREVKHTAETPQRATRVAWLCT